MFQKKTVDPAARLLAKAINTHKLQVGDGSKGAGGGCRRKQPQPAGPLPDDSQDDLQKPLGVMNYVVQQMLAPLPARSQRPEPPTTPPSLEAGLSSENNVGEDDAGEDDTTGDDDASEEDASEDDSGEDDAGEGDSSEDDGNEDNASTLEPHAALTRSGSE